MFVSQGVNSGFEPPVRILGSSSGSPAPGEQNDHRDHSETRRDPPGCRGYRGGRDHGNTRGHRPGACLARTRATLAIPSGFI